MKIRMPADNEGFGVRRGVVSCDTSQEFGSSPPVRAFAKPRPNAKPQTVMGNFADCPATREEPKAESGGVN